MNEKKDHYRFENYGYPERWASYFHQVDAIVRARPKALLYVGVGDGVVPEYLKRNASFSVHTLDIAESLRPDTVGSVDVLPFSDGSFDAVACFEVLEHLPYDRFEQSLQELARVSKKTVFLSLPHFGPPVKFSLKVPFFPDFRFMWKVPYRPNHATTGEHKWEIGKKGYALARIREILKKHFSIEKEFVPFDAPYHHFFILSKKS